MSLVLFISEQTIKDRTAISDNIDGKVFKQTILKVQEEKLLPALGTALYTRLKAGITAEDLTADETTLMNTYITPMLTWYVMSELPMAIGVKFYNRSVLKKNGENSENVSMSEMFDVMKYYQNSGEAAEEKLIKYLRQTATQELFSEYLNPGTQIDTIHPKTQGYSCPIVLDELRPPHRNGYDYE